MEARRAAWAAAVCVTFDTDWAPDWCIRDCYDLCREADVGATFFITNESPVLKDIAANPAFELGMHPNFFPGSSHGETIAEVLDHMFRLLARYGGDTRNASLRTHGLFQHSQLHLELVRRGGSYSDVSLFLPMTGNLEPCLLWLDRDSPPLIRLPYYWEDDIAATTPGWDWSFSLSQCGGMKIFNFHPIHVALNTERMERYTSLRQCHAVPELTRDLAAQHINTRSPGTRTFLKSLLACIRDGRRYSPMNGGTVAHLAATWREQCALR